MNETTKKLIELSDGTRSSAEIAQLLGVGRRYVSKIQKLRDLPRLPEGARPGEDNHQFESGRRIGLDGYVLVTAPQDHPYARRRTKRETKLIPEHRLVLEATLGRYLLPEEVVDHIDGLTLHNAPSNLRLYASNRHHLSETLAGRAPALSPAGAKNTGIRTDLGREIQRVDMYRQRKEAGDVRLRQILLAMLSLGTDSPHLLGTRRHIEQAQIDMSARSTIERALADLHARWEAGQTLL
jgi:hypothetical protein